MNVYYLDRRLSDNETVAAARTLRCTHLTEAQWSLVQFRVPRVFSAPAPRACPSLRRYARLLRRHLERIGTAPFWHEHVAMVLAPCCPLNGALAFALRDASGLAPYMIVRTQGAGGALRVVEPGSMLEVIDPYRGRTGSPHHAR